jgi:SAM-dependent methyltransferase
MNASFDVNQYWLERGRNYMQETRTPAEFHRLQERFLLDVLRCSDLRMRRIFEIGCGFGRITRLVAEAWPEAEITALDLSPEQLANARRYCGNERPIQFEQYDFYSGAPFPGGDYDTVLAIEVFLHHPPEFIERLFGRLRSVAQVIVNIDWSERWPGPLPEHVWLHDYPKLFAQAGLMSAAFPLPQKVDGKQQKLFIAAPDLPKSLLELEERLREQEPPENGPAAEGIDDWTRQLRLATAELLGIVPSGTMLILVDDGQWGKVRALSGYVVVPFREREGVYWGPPESDPEAWAELQRLRTQGAQYLAFTWPAFWWLEHYREFSQRLRSEFRCVLENERLVIFKLSE